MYSFREEAKPKFNINYATLMALALLLLLITIGANTDVFQLNAADLAQMMEQKEKAERQLMFRFMDAEEDEEEPEDPKFVSDAQHIERAPTEEAPDEDPDPYSEGDTFELADSQASQPSNTTPQPYQPPQPQVQPQMPTPPTPQAVSAEPKQKPAEEQQKSQEEPQETDPAEPTEEKETVEETQDEAVVEEPEEVKPEQPDPKAEPTDLPKDTELKPEDLGDVAFPANAPRPYRPISQQEMAQARKSAMKNVDAAQAVPNRYVDSSRFDNRRGSGAPQVGLTVETTRDDLGAYLRILKQLVQGNWRIPNIAKFEVAGMTGISFKIKKDGTIYDVEVLMASQHDPLNTAAINAIKNTSPAPPLPKHVDEDFVPIKFGFYYNMRPRY